jgi:hypothetical protein
MKEDKAMPNFQETPITFRVKKSPNLIKFERLITGRTFFRPNDNSTFGDVWIKIDKNFAQLVNDEVRFRVGRQTDVYEAIMIQAKEGEV